MNNLNDSIDTLGLSIRSVNCLHRVGIHSIEDLLSYPKEKLPQIKNLGTRCFDEVTAKISEILSKHAIIPTAPLSPIDALDSFEAFVSWLNTEDNRNKYLAWLDRAQKSIDALPLLSTKTYNLLTFSENTKLSQLVFLDENQLLDIPRMDKPSVSELLHALRTFLDSSRSVFLSFLNAEINAQNNLAFQSFQHLLECPDKSDIILEFFKTNDVDLSKLGLSNRAVSRLTSSGYHHLSDIIYLDTNDLYRIPGLGKTTVDEIQVLLKEQFQHYEKQILACVNGDTSLFVDDTLIRTKILDLYRDNAFIGLSFSEISNSLDISKYVQPQKLKAIIGKLLEENILLYIDYRCYLVLPKFSNVLEECDTINERDRTAIRNRLNGMTLEAIGQEYGLTREGVRQILQKTRKKILSYCERKYRISEFDEDYYRYLFKTYRFDQNDSEAWLGISSHVWMYLDLSYSRQGSRPLEEALSDKDGLSLSMRLKIKNYLNRNMLFIDGRWVEKKRADLEAFLVEKICTDDVTFEDFVIQYNGFLEKERIPFDKDLYITKQVQHTRLNSLSDSRFLLWKFPKTIRYYNIDGQDYSELLAALDLDSYENTELSTVVFMRNHSDVIAKYDIRDQYELHNLLKKIVKDGSYHDFRCGRMPYIQFGNPDKTSAIMEIMINNAPVSAQKLAELVNEEFGFEINVILANYLLPLDQYLHNGVYSIDQKLMPESNKAPFLASLTDDFYLITELKQIYSDLFPNADTEVVNAFNLKALGFQVYSKYALRNYSTVDAYFQNLLSSKDDLDITPYRKRFTYVQQFSVKLMEMKRSLQIVEYSPQQILNFRKLEAAGITKENVYLFCDDVFEVVGDNEYFSAESLRKSGFQSTLYDLGFDDWFYGNLILSDSRFSFTTMFGSIILCKGHKNISAADFISSIIQKHQCIDTLELLSELKNNYGCSAIEKFDITYRTNGTEVYYDRILDRLYATKELYYQELEEGAN